MNAIHELYPHLCVRDAARAIDFYARAFGATELFRLTEPSGRIGRAELRFGPMTLMIADEFPECGFTAPASDEVRHFVIHLHVDDADALGLQAVAAGATMLGEPADQFYGERSCRLRDPFGHTRLLGHSIEQVEPQEMQRRYDALLKAPV